MPTKNLSIKYRPVRVGLLVSQGSVDDLVNAAGINTLLYGGMYNPIIPISEDNEFAERLLEVFNVDVIYPVSKNEQINAFVDSHPYLHNPHFYSTELFYEDWETKKNKLMYLDSLNIINHYWEKEFKHKTRRLPTYSHVIVRWSDTHPFKHLFSIVFGFYPSKFNLIDDFEFSFLSGLHGDRVTAETEIILSSTLSKSITPILLTSLGLESYNEKLYGNGIYVGDENDFTDLCLFWNVRATGTILEFLPRNHFQKFEGDIKGYVNELNQLSTRPSEPKERITAYCQSQKYEEVKELVKDFPSDKPLGVFPVDVDVIWNGWNLRPSNFYFGEAQTLASIDDSDDQYKTSFNLPDVPIIERQGRRIERQSFITSIDTVKEEDVYPEYTLKPPFIRKLNGFYGGRIVNNPYKVRVEEYGIRVITEGREYSLSLSPISYQSIINKIFDLAGLKVEVSQPGVLTKHILQKLGSIEGGRILKITGVRRLLDYLKKDDAITQSAASQLIFRKSSFGETELRTLLGSDYESRVSQYFTRKEEIGRFIWKKGIKKDTDIDDERLKKLFKGDFQKFENLYSPYGIGSKLTTSGVFRLLLKKEFLRAGLELLCDHCRLKNWLSLREIDDHWVCNYCGGTHQTSLYLSNECHWRYRKSGLFAKDNNQEGAIPVILTLLQSHRRLNNLGYGYSPSLRVKGDSVNCEVDLCILQYRIGGHVEIGIAECKSEGGRITHEDILNLKSVRECLHKIGVKCSLIFSKTAETFDTEEISLFRSLASEDVRCILLTNKELEPFDPYELYEQSELVDKHTSTLEGMAWNSKKIYLEK